MMVAFLVVGVSGLLEFAAAEEGSPQPPPTRTYTPPSEKIKEVGFVASNIAWVAGGLLSLAAWGIDVMINFGNSVLELEVVTRGWGIVLNFANLGFVLAIVVIAFATIFRVESYALKQTLWRLIVAAILVNFSLFIAGAFISISTVLMNVFKDATGWDSLSKALGNAIQPQSFNINEGKEPSSFKIIWGLLNGEIGWALAWVSSIVFVVIFTLLAVLVFFALFLMLLIRVIALVVLLITSPIIWLCWIFPGTRQYWNKWWQEFIRWNLFGPAVLFFIYLTVAGMNGMGVAGAPVKEGDKFSAAIVASAGEAAKAFESSSLLSTGFGQNVMRLFIACGLLVAGILVANSFGIAGGGLALKGATAMGKGVKGWAARKGIRASTYPLRLKKVSGWADKLQRVGAGWSGKGKGLGTLGNWVTTPIRGLGTLGKEAATYPVQYAREAEKEIDALPNPDERAMRWGNADMQTRIGILQSLRKTRDVELLIKKGGASPEQLQETVDQMQKHKLRGKDITEVVPILAKQVITDRLGEKKEVNILKALQQGVGDSEEAKKSREDADIALKAFISELSPGKFSAAQWRDMLIGEFRGDMSEEDWKKYAAPVLAKALAKGVTSEGAATLYRSCKKGERDLIHEAIIASLDNEIKERAERDPSWTVTLENRKKVLWEPGSAFYNKGFYKFFTESDVARDLGVDLKDNLSGDALKEEKDEEKKELMT